MKSALTALALASLLVAGGAAAQDPLPTHGAAPAAKAHGRPTEVVMRKAGSTSVDLRTLPEGPPRRRSRPEREDPPFHPRFVPGSGSMRANTSNCRAFSDRL